MLKTIDDCQRAAELGQPTAQYKLGLFYSTGKGVPLDYVEAHKWLNLAARSVAEAKALRAELAHDMSPREIAEAQRQAREWLQTHH